MLRVQLNAYTNLLYFSVLSTGFALYSVQASTKPPPQFPLSYLALFARPRPAAANGGRGAPPAGAGPALRALEAEPRKMAAGRLPPGALTLRQVRAGGAGEVAAPEGEFPSSPGAGWRGTQQGTSAWRVTEGGAGRCGRFSGQDGAAG